MGPFVCTSCSAPSDQASRCGACGNQSFTLSEDARAVGESAFGRRREARGQLVSITEAPSFRRRRAAAQRAQSR